MADGDIDDESLSLALRAVEARLRRRSDEPTRAAMKLLVGRLMGWSRVEIERRCGLSRREYSAAWEQLRAVLAPGSDGG